MDIQNNTSIPEVKETIVTLRQLSADEKVRRLAEFREKRLHDEISSLTGARREGLQQGRQQEKENTERKLRELGLSEADIERFRRME